MQLAELTEKLKALPLEGSLAGVLHITNDSLADVVQSDHTEVLYGKDWITEKLLGLSFCVTLFSFFQTNSRGAELLYQTVRDYIGETNQKVIFDLYSGTGTIAQILAPVAKHVTGAVSYTHLDVYKRQNLMTEIRESIDNGCFAEYKKNMLESMAAGPQD